MGFLNWSMNRASTTSGKSSITVCANDVYSLNREVAKAEQRGYVRIGDVYTAKEHGLMGPTTFYQNMAISQEAVQQIKEHNAEVKEIRKEKRERNKQTAIKAFNFAKDFLENPEHKTNERIKSLKDKMKGIKDGLSL